MSEIIDCSALSGHVDDLAVRLAMWGQRDDSKAPLREAANNAFDSIDAALTELRRIRDRLIRETREFDDAAMRSSGELLAKIRRERGESS